MADGKNHDQGTTMDFEVLSLVLRDRATEADLDALTDLVQDIRTERARKGRK